MLNDIEYDPLEIPVIPTDVFQTYIVLWSGIGPSMHFSTTDENVAFEKFLHWTQNMQQTKDYGGCIELYRIKKTLSDSSPEVMMACMKREIWSPPLGSNESTFVKVGLPIPPLSNVASTSTDNF